MTIHKAISKNYGLELVSYQSRPRVDMRGDLIEPTDVIEQISPISLVPDFRFIRSLNLHAGAFLESLVTFVRVGVGLSHVTIAHIN